MKPTLRIDKFGDDYNGFNIAGLAAKLVPDRFDDFIDAVIYADNFEEAIRRIRKYVDIVFVESA